MSGDWVQLLPGGACLGGPRGRVVDGAGAERARLWAASGRADASLGLEAHDGGPDAALEAARHRADHALAEWRSPTPLLEAVVAEVVRRHAARREFAFGARGLLALPSSVVRLARLIASRVAGEVLVFDDLDETRAALRALGVMARAAGVIPGDAFDHRSGGPSSDGAGAAAALAHVGEAEGLADRLGAVRARLAGGALLFCTVEHPWHGLLAHAAQAAGFAAIEGHCDLQVVTAGHAVEAPSTRDLWVLRAVAPGSSALEVRVHVRGALDRAWLARPAAGGAEPGVLRTDVAPRPELLDAGLVEVRVAEGVFEAGTGERLLSGLAEALVEPPVEVRQVLGAARWAAVCALGGGRVVALEYLHAARRLIVGSTPCDRAIDHAIRYALRRALPEHAFALVPPPRVTLAEVRS